MTKLAKTYRGWPYSRFDLTDLYYSGCPISLFRETLSNWVRAFETETPDSYVYSFSMPGFKKEDFKIEVKDSILTVRAKNDEQSSTQLVSLNLGADQSKVEAKLEDGVLKIVFGKLPEAKALQIEIK